MNSSKQIKLGAMMSYGMVLFNIIVGLLYTPWMVNKIGKSDYGIYVLVTTFLMYFVVDFGLWMAFNKILSQYRSEGKYKEEADLIGIATKIYVYLDIVVCVALFIAYLFIDSIFIKLTPVELYKFKTVFLIAAIFSLLSFPFGFIKGVFSAHEYFVELKYFDLANKIGVILVTIILLFFDFGLYALVIAYGIIPFIVNISRVYFLWRKGIRVNLSSWDINVAKNIFGISFWLLIVVLGELFINNISPSIIAAYSNTEQIAIFAIGCTIYGYVYTFATSINGLFLPKLSQMHANKQRAEIENLTIRVGRIQLLTSGYLILGILLTGRFFILAWMGEDFEESYYVAILLVFPGLIINAQQIESTYLFVNDKIKYRSLMMVLTAITSVLLSARLVPSNGAIGAAIGICTANIVFMLIGMNLVYYKILKFHPRIFLYIILKFTVVYLLIIGTFLLLEKYWMNHWITKSNTWNTFIFYGLIYSLLYFVFAYKLLANTYEKNIIWRILNKIRMK